MNLGNPAQSVYQPDGELKGIGDATTLRFRSLYSRLCEHAAARPSKVALTFLPSSLSTERLDLTYNDLIERAFGVSQFLGRQFERGERVLLLLPPTPEFAVAFLGCLAVGVIPVPLPLPMNKGAEKRLLSVAQDCVPSAIVSIQPVQDLISNSDTISHLCTRYEWLFVKDIEHADGNRFRSEDVGEISGNDIAFLQYTSGSSSSPRGVMVSHRSLMANEAAIHDSFKVSVDSTIVSWLPLYHDMGLIGGLLQPLYAGARGVILDSISFMQRPLSWLETISEEQADISGGPNFAYDLCTMKIRSKKKGRLDLRSWRIAFNGSAPVFPQTIRSFSDAFREVGFFPSSHVPCYGLAEATLLVAAATVEVAPTTKFFSSDLLGSGIAREVEKDSSSARELVAYPLPVHASVRVVDRATSQPINEGSVGEIVVAGTSNGLGYWGQQSSSATTFSLILPDEPATPYLRTGDLGFIIDGHLFIQGRSKDLIIHCGRNLHPDDLENDIWTCDPAVRFGYGVIFGLPHDGDEALVVCQEIRKLTPPDRHLEIAQNIRSTLARIHGVTARTVVLVLPHTLSKTTSGKLQRHLTKQLFQEGELPSLYSHTLEHRNIGVKSLADRLADPERNSWDTGITLDRLTTALCDHLQGLLGLPNAPTGEESLPSLGADSLTALQLQYEIEEALGVVGPPSMPLRAKSIADLAASAHLQGSVPRSPELPVHALSEVYELNEAQCAAWFLQQAYPQSTAFNITRAFRITDPFDLDKLTAVLSNLERRHSSLRLSVLNVDGKPQAYIRPPHPARIVALDARLWDEHSVLEWHREFATKPFDLKQDPLFRAIVLCRAHDWVLVLSLHHIVCDATSFVIIVRELAEEYRAEHVRPVTLPISKLVLSSGAYERAVLEKRGDELAVYWRKELAGEIPRLSLPGAGQGSRSHRASTLFTLDSQQTSSLVRFAKKSELTLHNLLLSAWQVLLHRLTGQRDIIIGVPTSGRNDRRLAAWVGYLVNVIPIRSSFHSDTRFIDFAKVTQQRMLNALDHQELPLSLLTRMVNPDRDEASSPLFQSIFAFYTTVLPTGDGAATAVVMGDPSAYLLLKTGTLSSFPLPDYATQADVCLNVSLRHDMVACELQSDPEKVSREQINQIETTFGTLLKAISECPKTRVGRLPLLTPVEVADLISISTAPQVARSFHYLRSFEQMVESCANLNAVDDGVTQLSYSELDRRSNHVATLLRELGVGCEYNVVVSAQRSVDYLVVLLGIHKADGCYVPISPREAPNRAAAMISAVEPITYIVDLVGRQMLTQVLQGPEVTDITSILDIRELTSGRNDRRPVHLGPGQSSSYIIHTSGSTGPPKAAVSTNAGLTNHLWQIIEYFDLGPEDCVGQTGPVSFDVSVWQLLAPLLIGGRVQIISEPTSLSPTGLLNASVRSGVTLLELVPSAVLALLDAGLARSRGSLRIMIATGEALNMDLPRRWAREIQELPLFNAYGPCECTDDVSIGLSAWGRNVPISISIGQPLTNTSIFILDDDLQPAPIGVSGWLYVGGSGVGRGYLGNPRRTASVFIPDPWSAIPGARLYKTGDLGRMTVTGNVEFLGRVDNQIKIRGLRIEPGEVEAALCECVDVVEAVVKVEDGPAGPFLASFIVLGRDWLEKLDYECRLLSPHEEETLRRALAEHLPRHMIPSVFVCVPRLPRSANGKIDYGALSYTPPASNEENLFEQEDDPLFAAVRSIWSSLLERDTVAWHDNFFQSGGHSLLALSMVDQVGQIAGLEVGVDIVFAYPRLRDFVNDIRQSPRRSPIRSSSLGALDNRNQSVPASAAQQRFWFLHEIATMHQTFNMPGVLRIQGVLKDRALDAALREVLERHNVLLAQFSDEGGTLTWTPGSADNFVLRRLDLRGAAAEFGEGLFEELMKADANSLVDLRQEIPFRAVLAQLGLSDWRLFISIDHIACDAWSLGVFLHDLEDSYNRRVRGLPPPATETQYDFRDYCYDEFARREQGGSFDLASEWRGFPHGTIRLAPRRTPTLSATKYGFDSHSFYIRGEVSAGLRELTKQTGTTPYMLFASALAALIHSGSEDRETIVLGTLIAKRDRAEWHRVVGPLLNVSILAIDLSLRDNVQEALRRAQDGALRAHRSSNMPYQELIRLFEPVSGGDGSPFEVLLVMQPEPSGPINFEGLTTDLVEIGNDIPPYPLVLDIEHCKGDYRLTHRFALDRYNADDIKILASRLEALTRIIAADSADSMKDILRRIEIPSMKRS